MNTPRTDDLLALAEYYDCTVDAILGRDKPQGTLRTTQADTVLVPLYGSIPAGAAIEALPAEGSFPVPKVLADRHPAGFLLRVCDEGMNKVLPNRSLAFVSPAEGTSDGMVYAVAVNGCDAVTRRVRVLANGLELLPDSTDPTFRPALYDFGDPGSDPVCVVGRVVYYVLPLDWAM